MPMEKGGVTKLMGTRRSRFRLLRLANEGAITGGNIPQAAGGGRAAEAAVQDRVEEGSLAEPAALAQVPRLQTRILQQYHLANYRT
jgi:hypothetical protein